MFLSIIKPSASLLTLLKYTSIGCCARSPNITSLNFSGVTLAAAGTPFSLPRKITTSPAFVSGAVGLGHDGSSSHGVGGRAATTSRIVEIPRERRTTFTFDAAAAAGGNAVISFARDLTYKAPLIPEDWVALGYKG